MVSESQFGSELKILDREVVQPRGEQGGSASSGIRAEFFSCRQQEKEEER
jgi:hypothetical protein